MLRHIKEGRGRIDTPIYDYGMVDDDFMLAPLTARWLLDSGTPRSRASAFLATRSASGMSAGDALVRNLEWVVNRTAGFASDPVPTNLIGIKAGRRTGNWRDSEEGLGRGFYPYDINVALVPAALDAIDRLMRSGVLDSYVSEEQRRVLSRAAQQRASLVMRRQPAFFDVSVPADTARGADFGIRGRGRGGLGGGTGIRARAVQSNSTRCHSMRMGSPFRSCIRTMDSRCCSGSRRPNDSSVSIETLSRPFPAGLLTPVGMLVANPVFADAELQERFSSTAYHGTVVWSWQQALMAAGLDRQLARPDLPAALRRGCATRGR